MSTFVGREREVAAVGELVRTRRLVTLTGTGGIGKSRLGLEVTSRSVPRYDGRAWIVDLSPLVDGDLVVAAVATALGLREQPVRGLLDTVCEFVGERAALLVLDNCEHVLDASVTLVEALLKRCPKIRVLATSREALRAADETVWHVPPLSSVEATALFLDRASMAGAASPTSDAAAATAAAVRELSQRLEGLPLAIELAAVQTRTLSIDQILDRLGDALRLLTTKDDVAPARQQTLHATIAWSYDLLTPAEQRLLEDVSVFIGGWTAASAQAISTEARDTKELLERLVERSLIVAEPAVNGETRYRLQDVVRQFSQERLHARGDAPAVRARHAQYFMQLVRDTEARGLSAERPALLDRLELELDNLRAARHWFVASADGKAAQRFEAGLYRLLMYRGHATEGRQSLVAALSLPGGSISTRAKALQCVSALAFTQADYADAAEYGMAGLVLHRETNEPIGLTYAFSTLGMTAAVRGDFDASDTLLEAARQASQVSGSTSLVALSLALSAYVAYLRGQNDTAREFAHGAIEAGDAMGFAPPSSMAIVTLGSIKYDTGDCDAAADLLRAGLERAEELGETYLSVRASIGLALLSADRADVRAARDLLDDGLGRALALGNRHHVAQALEGVAAFAASLRRGKAALRFAAAASSIRTTVGAPLSPTERRMLETRLGPIRHALGAAQSASAHAEGGGWSLEKAASEARTFLVDWPFSEVIAESIV